MLALIKWLLLWMSFTPISSALEPKQLLLEASPSASLAGNLALRAEYLTKRDWRLATDVGYSQYQSAEIAHGADRFIDLSAQYYPDIFDKHGPYFGIGLQLQSQIQNFQRQRPRRTYFQPDAGNDMDSWMIDSMSVSLTQSIGYRLMLGEHLTTSVGAEAAENLYSSTRIRDRQLLAGSEIEIPNKSALETRFMMNIGFVIP